MLKKGKYIDFKWYKKMMSILDFKSNDQIILNKLYENFTANKSTKRNLDSKI